KVRGWDIAGIYRDEGFSGTNTGRPEYQQMMDEMAYWDVLLVLKMDRIHRNSVNFANMMANLEKNHKEFDSLMEQFDTTTAMGRFVMDIVQRIAQLESEQIGERVLLGMTKKAETGSGPMGSGQPYGYLYAGGQLVVVTAEAAIVRRIYDLYARGCSMQTIADNLNNANIPSKTGVSWSRQAICNILHNPLYAGYQDWNGILRPGTQEAIISVDQYESVNGPLV
ncbi:MAG: recombinase family protein, partial [Candidatus Methanomethylophilus sp.]|nr:recombinase family protein [Methanomethylophilus sp.]